MATIKEKLSADLKSAMIAKDKCAMSAFRGVKSAITIEETSEANPHELTDTECIKVIQKYIKQRQESFDIYSKAGRDELAADEKAEIEALDKYLPKMLDENTLNANIDAIIYENAFSSMKDMKQIMSILNDKFSGMVDGKAASTYVKSKFC